MRRLRSSLADLKKVDAPPSRSLEKATGKNLNGSQTNATQILQDHYGRALLHYPNRDPPIRLVRPRRNAIGRLRF
jgi:hypothetical protein